jgi:hypothetical protein
MKRFNGKALLAAVLFFLAVPAVSHAGCPDATNNAGYVRAGATGTGSGADWTNAYTNLPASLVRGCTYYVAAGTYPPHTFNDAVSGTTTITLQAPTAASHGTATGWSSAYVGEAVWSCSSACGPIWNVGNENYFVANGAYCTPNANYPNICTQGTAGFVFQCNGFCGNGNVGNGCTQCGDIMGGIGYNGSPATSHDQTFEYLEVDGNNQTSDSGLADACFDFEGGSYDLYFGHNYLQNCTWDFFLKGSHQGQSGFGPGNNITVEQTYMTRDYTATGSTGPHGTPCSCSEGLTSFTWRYNLISNMVGTNFGPDTASGGDYNSGNGNGGPWYMYGNIWYADDASHCAVGDGVLAIYDFSMTNGAVYFYNNSIVNEGYPFCPQTDETGFGLGLSYTTPFAGWYEQNNLWYGDDLSSVDGNTVIQNGTTSNGQGASFSTAAVHGYDAWFGSPNSGGNDQDSNKQISSSNPFTNVSADNFTVAVDTTAGVSLTNVGTYWNGTAAVPNTFNIDMNGTTRGSNGTWDRGALQFTTTVAGPQPPTSVQITNVQ